jgi:hypothetical protein
MTHSVGPASTHGLGLLVWCNSHFGLPARQPRARSDCRWAGWRGAAADTTLVGQWDSVGHGLGWRNAPRRPGDNEGRNGSVRWWSWSAAMLWWLLALAAGSCSTRLMRGRWGSSFDGRRLGGVAHRDGEEMWRWIKIQWQRWRSGHP